MSDRVPGTAPLVQALHAGDPLEIAALIAQGADVGYVREHGYDALLDAVHGRDISRDRRLIELLSLLVQHGVRLDGESSYRESALRVLSHIGRFDGVRLLLDSGADPGPLGWTPLMRAVALGSVEEAARELDAGADLAALDWWRRTAFAIALLGGDLPKATLLFNRGASADVCGAEPALFYAVDGHQPAMVRWLLDLGAEVDQADQSGVTALMHAAERDDGECLGALLSAGADVGRYAFGTALARARSRGVIERLIAGGADPADLTAEGRRALAGLSPDPDPDLLTATPEQFHRASTRRFGAANPEPMSEPFWLAMVQSGVDAWAAGEHYSAAKSCPRDPIWSAKRFGQSVTPLPDGRVVFVAGEHEDHYDADFCIYNDVIVVDPDRAMAIYGYPEALFPPTDFHTATLLVGAIYVIGSLGYQGRRAYGETPVFRLDLPNFRIERLAASGDAPGWIYGHRADAQGGGEIRITKGTVVTSVDGKEQHQPNAAAFVLDVECLSWRRELP